MKLLGLNSPEIFIIFVILLSILGPKRIEKGFSLFKKLLKFLLSKDEDQSSVNSKVKPEEAEESVIKVEIVESEVKSEKPEESEVKAETIEPEVKSEEQEESEVKAETIEPEVKSINPKKRTVKDEIIDVKVDSDNK
jgi:hypothetical protein